MTRQSSDSESTGINSDSDSEESYEEWAGIDTLSEDILLDIFLVLRDLSTKPSSTATGSDWVVVSQVCRFWRSVALNHPPLWSNPDVSQHSCYHIKTYLERAKSIPLTIDNSSQCKLTANSESDKETSCRKCEKVLTIALLQLPQIRVLRLKNLLIQDLDGALLLSAPLLEELSLSFRSDKNHLPVVLPLQFLEDPTLALRRINFENCAFNLRLQSLKLKALTHLILTDQYRRADHFLRCGIFYPKFEYLIPILKSSPNLSSLSLDLVKHVEESLGRERSNNANAEIIELPHVVNVNIREISVGTAEDFFDVVKVPNFSELTIGLRCEGLHQMPRIISLLNRLCVDQVHVELKITFRRCSTIFSFSLVNDGIKTRDIDLIMYLIDYRGYIKEMPDPARSAEMVATLLRDGIWNNATHLKLNLYPNSAFKVLTWSTILRARPDLTDLTLEFAEETDHMVYVKKINDVLSALSEDGNGDLLLPNLKGITIAFGEMYDGVRNQLEILKFLQDRNSSGNRLSYLRFDRCASSTDERCVEWTSLLSQYVDKPIQWDGGLYEWIRYTRKHGIITKFPTYRKF